MSSLNNLFIALGFVSTEKMLSRKMSNVHDGVRRILLSVVVTLDEKII